MHSELLYNQWFGKALGFTSAFVFAPTSNTVLAVFVIVGIGLGHLFDIWAARQTGHTKPAPKAAKSQDGNAPLEPYHSFLFSSLGHIAKRSGTVRPAHIASAETVMRSLQFSAAQRQEAIAAFSAGKASNFNFQKLAAQLQLDGALSAFMTHAFCDVAAIAPEDNAITATVKLAGMVNIPATTVANSFGAALEQRKAHTAQSTSNRHPPSGQEQSGGNANSAYDVLGIANNSSAAEAKKAYRKLVSQAHPDKLPPNATEKEVLRATQRMVVLREALESIQRKQKR